MKALSLEHNYSDVRSFLFQMSSFFSTVIFFEDLFVEVRIFWIFLQRCGSFGSFCRGAAGANLSQKNNSALLFEPNKGWICDLVSLAFQISLGEFGLLFGDGVVVLESMNRPA